MSVDLAIAYRIYPGISKTPVVYGTDKLKMSEFALASFKRSLGSLRVRVYAILDSCPEPYERMFQNYFADSELSIIHCNKEGNAATFARQIDLMMTQTDAQYVYLAEDDYFYRDNAMMEAVTFMRKGNGIDFVTLYDHPDYYTLPFHHRSEQGLDVDGIHWTSRISTCLTFLTTAETLQKTAPIFKSFSRQNLDTSIWMALRRREAYNPIRALSIVLHDRSFVPVYAKAWLHSAVPLLFGKRYTLWAPTPSLATHLESTGIAPGVEWGFDTLEGLRIL
jgi:hypothetical protein